MKRLIRCLVAKTTQRMGVDMAITRPANCETVAIHSYHSGCDERTQRKTSVSQGIKQAVPRKPGCGHPQGSYRLHSHISPEAVVWGHPCCESQGRRCQG